MAKIKIKNSVTSGSVPAGLSFGEVAVNIPDKKIFIGNAVESTVTLYDPNNHVLSFNGSTGAVSFVNYVASVNGVTGAITNVAQTNAANVFTALQSFNSGISANSGTFSNQLNAQNLRMLAVGGDEGGQIDFNLPATNTSLTGGVSIDVFQNKVRIFESGGTNRGVFIDLSGVSASVGTNLVGGGGGGAVSSVSGSGNGISVSPTTGAVVVRNTGVHSFNGVTGDVLVKIEDLDVLTSNRIDNYVLFWDNDNELHEYQSVPTLLGSYVTTVNGATGAVTNVARTNEGNTFSVRQVMSSGITSSNLYVTSGGATFDSQVSVTTTTNAIDVFASTDGTGLRIAQATSGSSARVGGIRLGRSTTIGSNVYLEGYVGTFRVYNGISGTVASTGTKMLELSTSGGAIFDIPIAGATFSSSAGRITVQKSAYVGSDSGTVRIVGADVLNTQYNSDIRANADAAADTTHTLPAVTGTLLNTASSYVSGICGATGEIRLVAGSNMTITKSGNTFTFASTASGGSGGGGASTAFVIAMATVL